MTELKDSENIQEDDLDPEDNTMLAVMHQYIQDSRVKLNSYDSLYKKLSILKKIINIRFKHKILSFDSTQGFIFYPDNPFADIIPVSKLSSGEQNELVLFYELLFKCDEKDLILIDEPEISLHLEWLQEMIGDLKAVTSTNGASLLIATHSPDFVGDNYELVQNLS
jgi:predicted ATPase